MSWWNSRRNEPVVARIALPADRAQVGALLRDTWRHHGSQTLDDQASLLQSGLSTIALARQGAVGFLGVSARAAAGSPPEIWADINLVAVDEERPVDKILTTLLRQAFPALQAAGCTGLMCLTALGWLRNGLLATGFVETDQVVNYVHTNREWALHAPEVAHLRRADMRDADTILALNAAAFSPLWRYDDAALMSWLLTAEQATLAFLGDDAVGFALTSLDRADHFAHLIRVAIQPGAQGRGVGRQLVADALRYAYATGAPGLALNTQASNVVSRQLYEKLSFRLVDPVLAVLVAAP